MGVFRSDDIQVYCPCCGHRGRLPVRWDGTQRVRCPRCIESFYPRTGRAIPQGFSRDARDHPLFDEQFDKFSEIPRKDERKVS